MEVLIFGGLILFALFYNNTLSGKQFLEDNKDIFNLFKEDDYEFLLHAKYGPELDANLCYQKRITNAFITLAFGFFIGISSLNAVVFVLICFAALYAFKSQYLSLKSYYRKHLHTIDLMLPYYLKSLEILVQHYTVPVALGKSLDTAPEIFKEGLEEMLEKINAGDSSIDPYMEFANKYPVRDSMRMMRLLYRLGIGSQERKQERVLMFSRTVSSLQNKAREIKYRDRLDKMENMTMQMLMATGFTSMIIILVSMMMIMNI